MIVAVITAEKAEEIKGKEYEPSVSFSSIQDKHDKWIVSLVEAQHLSLDDIIELVEYEPIEQEGIIP